MSTRAPWLLPAPLQRRVECTVAALFQPAGRPTEDFSRPVGEPALIAPDSLSWRVFKNPVTLFIGGVAAVVLELAEPRVRSGVWEHTSFRTQPVERMRRTAAATVMTVYGPRSRAEAMIARIARLHDQVRGVTPAGIAYRASDAPLLDWVHATASFGFLEAWHSYVEPLSVEQRDRYFAEGRSSAHLYGATGAPASQAEFDDLLGRMSGALEPSPIVDEFLRLAADMPALARPLRPLQRLLVQAAVDILPHWTRERLKLEARTALRPAARASVCALARRADRLMLRSSAWVQSCRRLGLPDDYLYRPWPAAATSFDTPTLRRP